MCIIVSVMFAYMKEVNVFRCASIIILVGGWLRQLAFIGNNAFWILLAANSFYVLAAPILLNGISVMIIAWFRTKESNTAAAAIGIGSTVGGLIGNFIPGIYAIGLDKTDP